MMGKANHNSKVNSVEPKAGNSIGKSGAAESKSSHSMPVLGHSAGQSAGHGNAPIKDVGKYELVIPNPISIQLAFTGQDKVSLLVQTT